MDTHKANTSETREWDNSWMCWAWKLNGKIHREDGPAIHDGVGSQFWFRHGKRHREDGPAYMGSNGVKEWWLNGKRLSEDKWRQEVSKL